MADFWGNLTKMGTQMLETTENYAKELLKEEEGRKQPVTDDGFEVAGVSGVSEQNKFGEEAIPFDTQPNEEIPFFGTQQQGKQPQPQVEQKLHGPQQAQAVKVVSPQQVQTSQLPVIQQPSVVSPKVQELLTSPSQDSLDLSSEKERLQEIKARIPAQEVFAQRPAELLQKENADLKVLNQKLTATLEALKTKAKTKITELQTQLAQQKNPLVVRKLDNQLEEQVELIAALKLQIESLHKETALIRVKDQEIQSMLKSSSNVQSQLETVTGEKAQLETAIEQLQQEVTDLKEQLFDAKSVQDKYKAAVKALEQAQQVTVTQAAQLEELSVKLEQPQIEASSQVSQRLQESEDMVYKFQVDNDSLVQQLEESHQLNSETSAKFQSLTLQVETLKDELATSESKYVLQISSLNETVNEQRQKLQELEVSQSQHEANEASLSEQLVQARSQLQQVHQEKQASISQLNGLQAQHLSEVEAILNELRLAKQQYEPTVDVSALKQDFERINQDSQMKIKMLEQDNLRLRDRTIRAERLLADQQQSTLASQGKSISNGNLMRGVNTLAWLDYKVDENDIEGGSLGNKRPHSAGRGVLQVQHLARFYLRKFIRTIDMYCVKIGYILKEQPVARIGGIIYVAVVHIVLFSLLLN